MTPQEFLLKTFTVTIARTFNEPRLTPEGIASNFDLRDTGPATLAKVSISSISMVLSLAFVATIESLILLYGKDCANPNEVMIKAANLFDEVVKVNYATKHFPNWVDPDYCGRWRVRYEKAQIGGLYPSIRIATISTFFQQSTFSYRNEPAVELSPQTVQLIGEDVYDNYCIALRQMLGSDVLN